MEPPHARSLKGATLPSEVRAVCNRGLDVPGLIEGEYRISTHQRNEKSLVARNQEPALEFDKSFHYFITTQ